MKLTAQKLSELKDLIMENMSVVRLPQDRLEVVGRVLDNSFKECFEEIYQKSDVESLKTQFKNMDKLPIFEIEVVRLSTNEVEQIAFNVHVCGNKLEAQHEALTHKEDRSPMVAYKSLELDPIFSLDEHLQSLHELCTEAICNSDFFILN